MKKPPVHSNFSARVWAVVTIQVAWELQLLGVRCTPALMREVRRHVLLSLPPRRAEDCADAKTGAYVQEFLSRFRDGDYRRSPSPEPPRALEYRWRDALMEDLDPVGVLVWRLVYGDGWPVEQVETRYNIDRVVLAGAREGLRCALASLLDDESPTASVLDGLLCRLARMPVPECDGGVGAAGAEREHLERCPRCCRAARLIRAGQLRAEDLEPPASWAREQVSALALNLHPDARQHRKALLETFGAAVISACEDTLLIDLDRVSNHVSMLYALAEEGTPEKHHIRGALVRGPGHWHERGLMGPVAWQALSATRSRQWGEIDTVGTLPEVLPPPPSAAPWWSAAALAALLAIFAGSQAFKDGAIAPTFPLEEVSFERSEQGVQGRFDVDDRAYTLVVVDGPDGLEVLHNDDSPAEKGDIATGEGDFEIAAGGGRLMLAASAKPFEDVEDLVRLVRADPYPLEELAQRLDVLHDSRAALMIQPLPEQP